MCPPALFFFTSLHLVLALSLLYFFMSFSHSNSSSSSPQQMRFRHVFLFKWLVISTQTTCKLCHYVQVCVCVCCSPTEASEGQFLDGFSSSKVLRVPLSGTIFFLFLTCLSPSLPLFLQQHQTSFKLLGES